MKIDPHNHEKTYENWKTRTAKRIPHLTREDSKTLKRFLTDMERGLNTGAGARKGPRSYARLNTLRLRLAFLFRKLAEHTTRSSILKVQESELHDFFTAMRTGRIKNRLGQPYRSTADYVKVFKSFWHWHTKVERKRGVHVPDICVDLDTSQAKPRWVYLTEADVEKLCRAATPQYRLLMLFLFDTGIRAPTELVNVRAGDLLEKCAKLKIRDESAKTFGRTVNLLLSSARLRIDIAERRLGPDDQVFPITGSAVTRYLKRLGRRVLGDRASPAGKSYGELTMYDFRHSSACFWLPRYQSESGLKYRFGWLRSEMIHYYTELLGMRDTIAPADVHLAPERTELENRLAKVEMERKLVEEKLHALESDVRKILRVVERLTVQARPIPTPEILETATLD